MKTCRDCFHYTPCWKATSVAVRQHAEKHEIVEYCADFCEKRRVMMLCLGMDETVYVIVGGEVVEAVVEAEGVMMIGGERSAYTAESNAGYHYFDHEDIGEVVFLSREAAEAALAIREDKQA